MGLLYDKGMYLLLEMWVRLVFLAQHQFVDKINVVSCAGAASSAAAGTTVPVTRSFRNNL